MRDPSIHIKQSDLLRILQAYGDLFAADTCKYIMENAQPYQLSDRHIMLTNAAGKKDYRKAKEDVETDDDATNFNQALTLERRRLRHVFAPLTKQDRLWTTLTKLAKVGNQMATDFGIHKMEAYSAYVRIGVGLMAKGYALNKMLGYKDRVYEMYSDEVKVKADDKPDATAELKNIYLEEASIYYGRPVTYSMEHNIHFMEARRLADTLDADYRSFVMAQIQGLEFTGTFPEPYHLHSGQSEHRYLSRKKVTDRFTNTMENTYIFME